MNEIVCEKHKGIMRLWTWEKCVKLGQKDKYVYVFFFSKPFSAIAHYVSVCFEDDK